MKVQEMHYEVKRRINKVDSNQNRNLLIPEIDLALNEAQMLFVKMVAEPRVSYHLGVETTQRNIDELRTIIVHDDTRMIDTDKVAILPENYLYFLRAYVSMSKDGCSGIKARVYIQRHNDLYEESVFTKSSFEWRTVNGVFVEKTYNSKLLGGIKLTELNGVNYSNFLLSYIRRPKLIYYGSGFNNGGGYALPGYSKVLNENPDYNPDPQDPDYDPRKVLDQDCELPESTHNEIVDIAAMVITGDLASPDYQYKMAKLRFNEFK